MPTLPTTSYRSFFLFFALCGCAPDDLSFLPMIDGTGSTGDSQESSGTDGFEPLDETYGETESLPLYCTPDDILMPRNACEACICDVDEPRCFPLECPPPGIPSLLGRQFLSESVKGFALDPGTALELSFDTTEDRFPGQQATLHTINMRANYNHMSSGGYSLRDGRLTIDPQIRGNLVGGPEQEKRYKDLMLSSPEYEINDTRLTLRSGETSIVFNDSWLVNRPLEETQWFIDSLSVSDINFANALYTERVSFTPTSSSLYVSLHFEPEEGDERGEADCVDPLMSYQQLERGLLVDLIDGDPGSCREPDLTERLEAIREFLLNGPITVSIDITTLTLTNGADATMKLSTDRYIRN